MAYNAEIIFSFSEYVVECGGGNPNKSSAYGAPVFEATTNPRQFTQQEINNWITNSVSFSDILLARCEFPTNAGYYVSAYYVIKSNF